MKTDLHRMFEVNVSEEKFKRVKREILKYLEDSFTVTYNALKVVQLK